MAIYIKMGDIAGSVTEANHKGWIEAENVNFVAHNTVNNTSGNVYDRVKGKTQVNDFQIIKINDKSSPYLFQAMTKAQCIPSVTIDFCHTGSAGMQTHKQYVLSNVIISHYEDSTFSERVKSGLEYIKLSATKVEKNNTEHGPDGKAGQRVSVGYDASSAQSM